MNTVMFSHKSDEWTTPDDLYKSLDDEFHFDLDPCSTDENHKTPVYFTREQDGLKCSWGGHAYFVIHHIARLASGSGKHFTKRRQMILLSCC